MREAIIDWSAVHLACKLGDFKAMWQPAWTDDQKGWVLDLAKEGHSAGAIARMVNQRWDLTKSRNSVIGLCYRNGACLTGHASRRERQQRSKAFQARQAKASQPKEPKPPSKQKAALRKIFAAVEPLPEPSVTDIGRVHILKHENHQCAWVCGDPKEGMFCGEARVPGLPYCAPHSARAFRPPEVKTYDAPPTRALNIIESVEELQTA